MIKLLKSKGLAALTLALAAVGCRSEKQIELWDELFGPSYQKVTLDNGYGESTLFEDFNGDCVIDCVQATRWNGDKQIRHTFVAPEYQEKLAQVKRISPQTKVMTPEERAEYSKFAEYAKRMGRQVFSQKSYQHQKR